MAIKQLSVAFVHYPRAVEYALLESMPFGLNIVRALDKTAHIDLDLFLWEKDVDNYREYFSDETRICSLGSCAPFRIIKRKQDWLNYLNRPFIRLEIARQKKFDCVIGLGQIGIYIASILARHSNAPYVYINDEFPSSYNISHNSYWNRTERDAVCSASLLIAPDEQRIRQLCQELELDSERIAAAVIPNAITLDAPIPDIDWQERLGLPKDCIPLLHAGSVSDWAQVPEILGSMPYWPERAVLIINGRTPVSDSYKREITHLVTSGRVFWTEQPLRDDELNSLVSYAAASFGLYRDLGDNIRYIGWSSGKILRSIICGRPVIASCLPSLQFIEEHQLGCLVTHPAEIPAAVEKLVKNREAYANNCQQYAKEYLDFDKCWARACQHLQEISGLILR